VSVPQAMTNPTYTVLIVEDLPTHRELFRDSLMTDSSCDYHILEAESVKAGLELCRVSTRKIDVILLDYSLPDGNGLGFLTKLHAQSNGSSPPVVMVTGRGDESIATQAIKLGADDYLAKFDLNPSRLQSAISSAIETARLRLQLQHSNELLRVSLDTMLDCFGIYSAIRDASGEIIDFRFEYLNAAALESNQMTTADMSRGLCEVFPAQCETGLFAKYCQVVATGVPLILDNLIYTRHSALHKIHV
jgi:CheY-like chemotaxis protein